jgi:hypothetical protein
MRSNIMGGTPGLVSLLRGGQLRMPPAEALRLRDDQQASEGCYGSPLIVTQIRSGGSLAWSGYHQNVQGH